MYKKVITGAYADKMIQAMNAHMEKKLCPGLLASL